MPKCIRPGFPKACPPFIILCLCCWCSAIASIRFEKCDVDASTGVIDTEAHVDFKFTNDGKQAVIIKSIKPSCGCITTEADKKIILPGEKGVISTTVQIGDAQGRLDKTIVVETNDDEKPFTKLTAHIMVPRLVSLSPNPYVRWDQGGDATPQTVEVKVETPLSMKIIGLKVWHDKIKATLKEITPGKEYEITAWPTDTKDVINNAVELLNDAKPEKKIWLLVHVKPKGES